MGVTVKLSTLCMCLIIVFLRSMSAATTEEITTDDPLSDVDIALLPDEVAQIVEAISNVQKNTSKTDGKYPNIKVAGLNKPYSNSNLLQMVNESLVYSDANPLLNEIDHVTTSTTPLSVTEVTFTTEVIKETTLGKPQEAVIHSELEVETGESVAAAEAETQLESDTQHVEIQEVSRPTFLEPPSVGIFSYDGASQWYSWAMDMRDPNINPEGSLSWPTIVSRGVLSIVQYYNPLRRFMSRSLKSADGINNFINDRLHRNDAIKAAKNKDAFLPVIERLRTNIQNHENERVQNSENERIAVSHVLSSMYNTVPDFHLDSITDFLNATMELFYRYPLGVVNSTLTGFNHTVHNMTEELLAPFHVVQPEWIRFASLFKIPISTFLLAPLYVNIVNGVILAVYIGIGLLYLAYSGIDNFFLAPLPPDMDSTEGMLRFFGLQALMGPDYVVDYSELAEEEDEEAAQEKDAVDVEEEEEAEYDEEDTRRSDDKRRKIKNTAKHKSKKKTAENGKVYYNELPELIKPPPSRYSRPSYALHHTTPNFGNSYSHPVADSSFAVATASAATYLKASPPEEHFVFPLVPTTPKQTNYGSLSPLVSPAPVFAPTYVPLPSPYTDELPTSSSSVTGSTLRLTGTVQSPVTEDSVPTEHILDREIPYVVAPVYVPSVSYRTYTATRDATTKPSSATSVVIPSLLTVTASA